NIAQALSPAVLARIPHRGHDGGRREANVVSACDSEYCDSTAGGSSVPHYCPCHRNLLRPILRLLASSNQAKKLFPTRLRLTVSQESRPTTGGLLEKACRLLLRSPVRVSATHL